MWEHFFNGKPQDDVAGLAKQGWYWWGIGLVFLWLIVLVLFRRSWLGLLAIHCILACTILGALDAKSCYDNDQLIFGISRKTDRALEARSVVIVVHSGYLQASWEHYLKNFWIINGERANEAGWARANPSRYGEWYYNRKPADAKKYIGVLSSATELLPQTLRRWGLSLSRIHGPPSPARVVAQCSRTGARFCRSNP